jgi:hypothetical protein
VNDISGSPLRYLTFSSASESNCGSISHEVFVSRWNLWFDRYQCLSLGWCQRCLAKALSLSLSLGFDFWQSCSVIHGDVLRALVPRSLESAYYITIQARPGVVSYAISAQRLPFACSRSLLLLHLRSSFASYAWWIAALDEPHCDPPLVRVSMASISLVSTPSVSNQ